jgi:hypothetical protein
MNDVKKKGVNSSFYIPRDLKGDLNKLAASHNRSVSSLIVILIQEAIAKFRNAV